MESVNSDLVLHLIRVPFFNKSLEEQVEIISKGKPKPKLDLTQKKGEQVRHFQLGYYDKYEWLTGSRVTNKMYCWPCLLFCKTRKEGTFIRTGYDQLKNLARSFEAHSNSLMHLESDLNYAKFTDEHLSQPKTKRKKMEDVAEQNKIVRQNRNTLRCYLNITTFINRQILSIASDPDKKINMENNYSFLLDYTSQFDNFAKRNDFVTNKVFSEIKLSEALADTLRDDMQLQVDKSKFVSILIDSATNVTDKFQFAISYRYVHDGKVVEKFGGFFDLNGLNTAGNIGHLMLNHLVGSEFCKNKIVSQAYDGELHSISAINEIQAIVKEAFPDTILLHNHSQSLYSVFTNGTSEIQECRIFFSEFNALSDFLYKFMDRSKLTFEFCTKYSPNVYPIKWQTFLTSIYEKRSSICELFTAIIKHSEELEKSMLAQVNNYQTKLQDFKFCFILCLFNSIFQHIYELQKTFTNQTLEVHQLLKNINDTEGELNKINFDDIYNETRSICVLSSNIIIKEEEDEIKKPCYDLYLRIIRNITRQISIRFQDYVKIRFIALINSTHFWRYQKIFPMELFENLMHNYGQYFVATRLRTELTLFYSLPEFKDKTPIEALTCLTSNFMLKTFPQVHILLCLICSLPIFSPTNSKNYVSLCKRIKSYSAYKSGERKFTKAGLLSIESEYLSEISAQEHFFVKFLEKFADNNKCRDDFVFVE